MTRIAQTRSRWLSVMTIGFLAALLSAPSTAWAGSRDHDHERHSSHYRSHSDRADHHYTSHERRHRVYHDRQHRIDHKREHRAFHKSRHHASHKHHGKRRGHEKWYSSYYCKPCNHYFGARYELYDHVAYRHRVPRRHLEVAVSFGGLGWIFFGG